MSFVYLGFPKIPLVHLGFVLSELCRLSWSIQICINHLTWLIFTSLQVCLMSCYQVSVFYRDVGKWHWKNGSGEKTAPGKNWQCKKFEFLYFFNIL